MVGFSLASGETGQPLSEDIDNERIVARDVDVYPQVKLTTVDQKWICQIPAILCDKRKFGAK